MLVQALSVAAEPIFRGKLEKKQDSFPGRWQDRVFVLFPHLLTYLKVEKGVQETKGSVPLDWISQVKLAEKDSRRFQITIPDRVFELRAADEATARNWIAQIKTAVDSFKEQLNKGRAVSVVARTHKDTLHIAREAVCNNRSCR